MGGGGDSMLRRAFCWLLVGAAVALVGVNATPTGQPEGQLTIAFDTTIAPAYLDPAETTEIMALSATRSGWGRMASSALTPAWSWCSRRMGTIGARPSRFSDSSSRGSQSALHAWRCSRRERWTWPPS